MFTVHVKRPEPVPQLEVTVHVSMDEETSLLLLALLGTATGGRYIYPHPYSQLREALDLSPEKGSAICKERVKTGASIR